MVGILQQVNTEFLDEADHLVKHLSLLVHVNGQVWLISSQVHLLSFLVVTLTFKFTGFVNLNLGVLTLRQVPGDDGLSLFPFVSSHVHLKGLYVLSSVDEVFLSQVELTNFSVVLGDLSVVRSSNFWGLVLDQLDCAIPLSSGKSGLNCLVEDISLNEVFNCKVQLLLGD